MPLRVDDSHRASREGGGLALLSPYRLTQNSDYLARAQAISDWAESQLRETSSPRKGYRGGYGEDGTALAYRATEHNFDLFQLSWQLAAALKAWGSPSAGS